MTVVARTRIEWIKFQSCSEVLYGEVFVENESESVSHLCKIIGANHDQAIREVTFLRTERAMIEPQ